MNDLQARQTALDVQRSVAVAAPAGSGKTSLLVQRVLRLLARSQRPEEILAITFTRKAANEMRERILKALQQARDDEPVTEAHEQALRQDALAALEQDRLQGWNLLDNPSRLRLQTFDSLCRYLARRMALETGAMPPPNQLDNCMPDYREAVRSVVRASANSPLEQSVQALSLRFDGHFDQLVEQFAQLLDSRADWLELVMQQGLHSDQLKINLQQLVQSQLAQLQQALAGEGLLQQLECLLHYSISHQQELPAEWIGIPLTDEPAICDSLLPLWKVLTNMLLTKKGEVRKDVTKGIGFPTAKDGGDEARKTELKAVLQRLDSLPQLVQELQRVAALPETDANPDNLQMLEHLARFLPVLAAQLQVHFQDNQRIDYLGIAIHALRALGTEEQPTNLAMRLDYRFRHILVDEFQDTSALQVQMIERLVGGWQPEDGRTLFLVGDPMQSIYEFRRARVGLFIRARQHGLGGIPLDSVDLSRNFRSDPAVVNWVNQQFKDVFPEDDDPFRGQVRYRASEAARTGNNSSGVITAGYAQREEEMAAIADSIAAQVKGGENDIAVLARKRAHLELLAPLLKQRGVPFQARDVQLLNQCQHVMDIHCLVRVLHSLADRIAWLALLRTPVAGLDNSDLWHLAGGDDPGVLKQPVWSRICRHEDIGGISPQGHQILQRLQSCLAESTGKLGQMNLRDLVESTWRKLGGWQALLHPAHDQDLEDYLDLLEQHACAGRVENLDILEQDLGRLYSRPIGDDQVPVRLMTIHAAKGLEFDRVYLPCLDSGSQNNNLPPLVWQDRITADGERHFYAACQPRRGEQDPLYSFLWEEEKTRRQDELSRLLYVASTRAARALHLSGTVKYNEETQSWKPPSKGSLLHLLWPSLEADFLPPQPPDNAAEDEPIPVLAGIRRLDPARTTPLEPIHKAAAEPAVPLTAATLKANSTQRAIGDILHRSMQRLVEQGLDWQDEALKSSWKTSLLARGIRGDSLEQALAQLQKAMQVLETSQTAAWLTDSKHAESACEKEFVRLYGDGSVQRMVVDRTFLHQGTRWVVDYKSALPAEGETPDEFIARETERYRPQMQAYSQLFDDPDVVKAALYFPLLDRLQEVR